MNRRRIFILYKVVFIALLLSPFLGKSDDLSDADLADLNALQNSEEGKSTESTKDLERSLNEEMGAGTQKTPEVAVENPVIPAENPTTAAKPMEEPPPVDNRPGQLSIETQQTDTNSGNSSVRNEITNLEFKLEGTTSRILVSSRARLAYSETRNASMKQVVYMFHNTTTSQKYERAYDTTEFVSPVALFTLLQIPKTNPPTTKLIVQLREDKTPNVINTDKGMYIDFAAPDQKYDPKLLTADESKTATEENIYSGNQVFSGKSIKRLEVKNSDVQDVIRLIAKTSGYNVIIGDDVTGKVGTMSLENVPWDQALTLVLQTKKLGYIKQGNVLRIGTLAGLKSEKEEAIATENSKMRVEALRTVIVPISYAKATEMVNRAKAFLSERGSADADTRSNSVILKDIDRNVTKIQKLFAVLDSQPPKVNIAAKFVEMSETYSRRIGLNHQFTGNLSGLNFTQTISGGTNGTNGTTVITAPNFAGLQTTLQVGESDQKVKVLASPSLAINSNQKGTIQHGTNFTFEQAVFDANGRLARQLTTVTANLILDVTPIVAGDGSISMDVSIQNDIPRPENSTFIGSIINIDTRKINTQVLVENGDTIVIGGVFKDTVSTTKSGLPLLMHIPLLGYLFSGTTDIAERGEIMVFLTPKLLNSEEAFKRSF